MAGDGTFKLHARPPEPTPLIRGAPLPLSGRVPFWAPGSSLLVQLQAKLFLVSLTGGLVSGPKSQALLDLQSLLDLQLEFIYLLILLGVGWGQKVRQR